jgi:hypothetical protein
LTKLDEAQDEKNDVILWKDHSSRQNTRWKMLLWQSIRWR